MNQTQRELPFREGEPWWQGPAYTARSRRASGLFGTFRFFPAWNVSAIDPGGPHDGPEGGKGLPNRRARGLNSGGERARIALFKSLKLRATRSSSTLSHYAFRSTARAAVFFETDFPTSLPKTGNSTPSPERTAASAGLTLSSVELVSF